MQKRLATRVRGIAWEFTFEQWCKVWIASGKWNHRTNKTADGYVMSRPGDTGPYAEGNVKIITHRENIIERNRLHFAALRREDERPDDWYERETGEAAAVLGFEEELADTTPF